MEERAWDEQKTGEKYWGGKRHPLPYSLFFALSRSFCPVRKRLEKERKRLLRRLHLTLNDWSQGELWILFSEKLSVSGDEVEGNKIDCSPRDHSLNDLLYNKTKQNKSKIWKTRWGSSDNMRPPLITCSSGQHFAGNSELFPVWRHSFRNPAHGNWRETVSLLDVMWKWSSQWMGAL